MTTRGPQTGNPPTTTASSLGGGVCSRQGNGGPAPTPRAPTPPPLIVLINVGATLRTPVCQYFIGGPDAADNCPHKGWAAIYLTTVDDRRVNPEPLRKYMCAVHVWEWAFHSERRPLLAGGDPVIQVEPVEVSRRG